MDAHEVRGCQILKKFTKCNAKNSHKKLKGQKSSQNNQNYSKNVNYFKNFNYNLLVFN